MRSAPTILLVLAFPAGVLGYAIGVRILMALGLPDVLVAFGSLFIASLVMMPFIIPFLDRRAKADLAAHARQVDTTEPTQDS